MLSPQSFKSSSSGSSVDSSISHFSLSESRRRLSSVSIASIPDIDDYLVLHDEVELGEKIGEGTFGTVYLGQYQGENVAVKILHCVDEQKFEHEVKQTKLRHPCIAGLKAVVAQTAHDNEPSYYYIITEYAPGGSLADFFKKNSNPDDFTWLWRITLALDIAKGLLFLHENNVIHRDLKSENVLLDAQNAHAKLCDFGLAITKAANNRTIIGELCGTSKYLAPELLQEFIDDFDNQDNDNICTYSFATDIYALAVVLFELIDHKKSFHGFQLSILLYKKIINENFRPEISENTPVAYQKIIKTCWQKQSELRMSADLIVEELQDQHDKLKNH